MSFVYFADVGPGKFIKIGVSHHPGVRIRSLQAESRDRFGLTDVRHIAVILGTSSRERFEQSLFSHLRIGKSSEWLVWDKEIIARIDSLRQEWIPESVWQSCGMTRYVAERLSKTANPKLISRFLWECRQSVAHKNVNIRKMLKISNRSISPILTEPKVEV